ncbi:opacity protein-like surface antigen [Pararhizobium capsulatum DSM 1112]|uniref:Opacity protein-like surface antigen n=2 Tax=Pararhizobium capsulatum TaxID=34014 RepID=A0ABU0BYW6_9HYPH|nr:opacity protein-like surface antigen [Pararhizobium capsulatum DSM 1112]
MKYNIVCMAAAAALIFGLQSVAAADVYPPAATSPTWSGCYLGVNTGYGRADADTTDMPFGEGPFAGSGSGWNDPAYETIGMAGNGLTGGVETGCDQQFDLSDKTFVVGGVLDFSLMNLGATGTSAIQSDTHTSFDMDWAASARLRAGVTASDVLFYVTGGVAFADINVRAFDRHEVPTQGLMDVSGGGTETGWVAGGGVEWRFQPNWSVGLEYLHYDFGAVTATGAAIEPVGAFPRFESDIDADVIRVGLKWRM